MRLVWNANTEDVAFLKNEKQLKLIYNLDSFTVNGVSNLKCFSISTKPLFDSIKKAFEVNFNKVSKKKFQVSEGLVDSSYNYVLKITPLKFYNFMVHYSATPSQNGYPGSRACSSTYFKGDYLVEIINIQSSKIVASFSLTNLTNKYPMSSNCGKNKYSKNIHTEIYRSELRAGTEAAKYILKLRRKSKKS